MNRIFKLMALAVLAFMLIVPAAQATNYDYWAYVYSWDGSTTADGKPELVRQTSGITFLVLSVGTDTWATCYEYADDAMTSLTNPITTTNYASDTVCHDQVAFRITASTCDIIVVDTDGGYTKFFEDFSPNDHTIVIDERPNIQHHGCMWADINTMTETDTGIDFQYDTMISCVQPEVVTVDSGMSVDIGLLSSGTNGDADGFIDGASLTTAGYPLTTLTTSGALMDDGTNFDPDGHAVISANEQSLTFSASGGADTGVIYIHYWFTRMR